MHELLTHKLNHRKCVCLHRAVMVYCECIKYKSSTMYKCSYEKENLKNDNCVKFSHHRDFNYSLQLLATAYFMGISINNI